ncbi:methionine adenosyltransferase [Nocardiopsis sp. Huas11]|uniref:methionine adenosyltransferase n=1 Tax=Nocardiopsis sp. Huas11 TaxID=2183912 RepID=UPI000EAB7ECA|nr:methionine adenosyltransferase [Nocardiopsis sp. Huas11]RKS06008.1 methionine adenosyltransferase [Nocardiopsis sp. Huas11]
MEHSEPSTEAGRLTVRTGVPFDDTVSIVERKGLGHPDTMADHLAEALSRAYSAFTLERFGVILHHNFDKLALLGGASEVRYGGGRMVAPIRVLVNGRAAHRCGDEILPVGELVESTVHAFFQERLPEAVGHLDIALNVTANPSPGAVITGENIPERSRWFAPRDTGDLRERRTLLANDTSLGTGWAPRSPFEGLIRELADTFSSPGPFTNAHPWCGSDVKVMGSWDGEQADLVLCVPQKSSHVTSRTAYLRNAETVRAECHRIAGLRLPGASVNIQLNARDVPSHDELYLTYTGSSIESGDEGVVGRGNRVNGLITPLRPMNMEGANGKNPVYHVGKLYNLAAERLAHRLHEETGEYAEVHLVSTTGQPLDQPGRILVRLAAEDAQPDKIQALVAEALASFPDLTNEIVREGVCLS